MAEFRILSAPAVCACLDPSTELERHPKTGPCPVPSGSTLLMVIRKAAPGPVGAKGVPEMRTTVYQDVQAPGHLWKLPWLNTKKNGLCCMHG